MRARVPRRLRPGIYGRSFGESQRRWVDVLKIRTSQGMVVLNAEEADQLRERLRRVPSAQVAEGTIRVSANASTSVTFTETEKVAVLEVLNEWLNGEALSEELEREQ